jgi:hypothetical protein
VVPQSEVERAILLFSRMPDFCIPFRPRHYYTPLQSFQRFKVTGVVLYFLIVPDRFYSLSPLSEEKFVMPQPAPFPVLYLTHYVEGLARLGKEYRVVLEYLVDSMDLDEAWCTRNLDPASPAWQVILDLAKLKKKRLGKHMKYDGNITAVIENQSQLEAALRIPGRDLPEVSSSLSLAAFHNDSVCILGVEDVAMTDK